MRKITKLLTLALAALMIMGAMPVGAAFTDVSVDNEALYESVELLTTLGVAKGTSDTTFGPDELVTRQQMAAFVYRLMKAGRSSEGGVNTTPFTDLEDSTFFNMISWANSTGIIKGRSATEFDPKGNIVLQDAYVMLVRALGYEKDGALSYPNAYIDKAEEIGLDEDIPSSVDYTASLTRGQVAIILANAFYADMNETTVKYEWIDNGKDGEEKEYAYIPVETQETVAHKIFGVEEEKFVVTATAHYGFGTDALYTETSDVDIIKGNRYDASGAEIGTDVEIEMDDLGLDGSSDDYFMAELTLFVKKDSSDWKKDEFIAAKSNLIKTTVKASDVAFERSNKTDKEYYVGGVKNADAEKVITGYVTLGGTKAYLDAKNAPYSYKKLGDDGKDKESVKFIDLTSGNYDKENATFKYDEIESKTFVADDPDTPEIETVKIDLEFDGLYDSEGTNGSHDKLSNTVDMFFPTLYNGGIYEADVYDVDGDGFAEYIFVKDYNLVEISDKKNTAFSGIKTAASSPNFITTKDVTIEGDYAANDVVLAYVNKDAKYVKIAEKLSPVESMISSKSETTENGEKVYTYTLKSGDVISTKNAAEKYVAYTAKDFKAGKTIKAYIKDGVLLYSDSIGSTGEFDANANYAILKTNDDGDVVYTASGVVDGNRVSYYYVDAIMDGAVKSVKLGDYVNAYYIYNNGKLEEDENNLNSIKITEKTRAVALMTELLDQFVTYTIDADGAYTFSQCKFSANAGESNDFDNKDDEIAVLASASSVNVEHYTGSIYSISGINRLAKFNVRDYSQFIVKSTDDDGEDVYTVYTNETLPKFDKTTFKHVEAVFVNNTKSNIESLGIFYGEAEEFNSKATKDYRIATSVSTVADANGKEKTVIEVLDIKTGTKTSNIEVASGNNVKAHDYVVIREDGKAESVIPGTEYDSNRLFTKNFGSYDSENKFLTLADDNNTYFLNEDTTILYYTSGSVFQMAEEDILTTEDNPYEGLEDATALKLAIVADSYVVKSIVVKKG